MRGCVAALETDDLAGQLVDAAGHGRVPLEELVLNFIDVVLQARDNRLVLVDHLVKDRVQHRLGTEPEQFRRILESFADSAQVGGFSVANGYDEVFAGEDVQFPELDIFGGIDVTGGAKDGEERRAVALDLGALMGRHRVLDGQLVQVELACD